MVLSGQTSSMKRINKIKNVETYNGSFHEAVGSILAIAQFFGVMPVIGVKSDCTSKLQFKWQSRRTMYSIIAFVLLACYAGLTVFDSWRYGIRFDAMSMISCVSIFFSSKINR